jgi:hypothetical protein
VTIPVILSLRTVPPHPRAEFEYANEKRKRKAAIKVKNERGRGWEKWGGLRCIRVGGLNKKGGGSLDPLPTSQNNPDK